MNYKSVPPHLIAIDLDGTLLTDDKKIDARTKRYLQKLESVGHHIVIATGRPLRAIERYYRELNLHAPIVCYNGACITNPSDATFPSRAFSFSQKVVKNIFTTVGNDVIDNVMCETNKKIWLLKEDSDLAAFFWHNDMEVIYGDLLVTLSEDPMTMIIKSHNRNSESDQKLCEAVKQHPGLKIRFWNRSNFSEIFFEHISKGHAIIDIATHYHIPQQHILAFGDAENDIEMLAMAGTGFAMSNGVESIKQHADVLTKYSNNEFGIFHALKRYFKQYKI